MNRSFESVGVDCLDSGMLDSVLLALISLNAAQSDVRLSWIPALDEDTYEEKEGSGAIRLDLNA